ncbi:hypothetical protein ZYGR_0AI06370 [Zygosaccharomyces rouxii]|uniref:Uncharacterized protein n=1 Tax=Zygosaccharomyces rouxii TaxID=4956 RepID=A0A1Q3ACY1_ZYGRO|nr:hypothetical protein ZYGR_0AI06370 [Zygosaccharomyces rouxii]
MGEISSAGAQEPLLPGYKGLRIEAPSTRRRKKVDKGLLGRFSKWDHYRQASSASASPEGESVSRRPSVRRTDFTNRKEYNRYQKQNRFIFHRGFFRRNAHNRSIRRGSDNRVRLKNKAELNAALQYVDLSSFTPEDVVPTKEVVTFTPTQLRQRTPAVVISSIAPIDDYTRSLGRTVSIKRSIPTSPSPPRDKSTPRSGSRPNSTLHRSLSTPASIKNIRRRSYSPQRLVLQNMWREYLYLVIVQRLQLRVSLLSEESSDDSAIVPPATRTVETKEGLHGDPIPSAAEGSPSVSLINARRKAL